MGLSYVQVAQLHLEHQQRQQQALTCRVEKGSRSAYPYPGAVELQIRLVGTANPNYLGWEWPQRAITYPPGSHVANTSEMGHALGATQIIGGTKVQYGCTVRVRESSETAHMSR
eukprot:1112778-Rhodomonas_salina.2